ncbi:GGDEF domain-containing protein [Massilia glaciei]|uniref:GGDEF domain-containing protein n=1 Tax=Massilia glaciei TaxID=1524097 RepID=UPI0015E81FBC|nr:GGDEF domain-containing protein [Massilia glaciei]
MCCLFFGTGLAQAAGLAQPAERAYGRVQFAPQEVRSQALTQLKTLAPSDPLRADWLAVAGDTACVLSLGAEAVKWSTEGLAMPNLTNRQTHRLTMARTCGSTASGESAAMLAMLDRVLQATAPSDNAALADIHAARGVLYNTLENYETSLDELYKALRIAPLKDARTIRADVLVSIAYVQHQSNAFDEAEQNFRAALDNLRGQPPSVRLSIAQFRLASLNIKRGVREEEAKILMRDSRETAQKVGDLQGVAYSDYGLGKLAFRHNDLAAAERYMNAAKPVFESAGDQQTVGWVHLYLGRMGLANKRYPQALAAANSAFASSVKIKDETLERTSLELRSKIKAATGNKDGAYDDLLLSKNMNEKIVERQQRKIVLDLQSRFDIQKQSQDNIILKQKGALQEAELVRRRQQQEVYLAATVALAFALIAAVLAWWHRIRHGAILKRMAETDVLTGLVNRRCLMERMAREFARSRRHHLDLTMAVIDIDFFKKVNDTYGHHAGDEVLRELARTALQGLRIDDVLARLGGEEFVLMMPHTDQQGALIVIDRIRTRILQMNCPLLQGAALPTFSAGLAVMSAGDASADGMLERADLALYAAKEKGRNRTEIAASAG